MSETPESRALSWAAGQLGLTVEQCLALAAGEAAPLLTRDAVLTEAAQAAGSDVIRCASALRELRPAQGDVVGVGQGGVRYSDDYSKLHQRLQRGFRRSVDTWAQVAALSGDKGALTALREQATRVMQAFISVSAREAFTDRGVVLDASPAPASLPAAAPRQTLASPVPVVEPRRRGAPAPPPPEPLRRP